MCPCISFATVRTMNKSVRSTMAVLRMMRRKILFCSIRGSALGQAKRHAHRLDAAGLFMRNPILRYFTRWISSVDCPDSFIACSAEMLTDGQFLAVHYLSNSQW